MELAAEFGLSSDQLVSSKVRAWRNGGDEALRPNREGPATRLDEVEASGQGRSASP
ncbi:helix-turn-helix domain-containing protein [uncultured Corynebacterium sp.]|uniref:helix-turn-helix domain-containing protein n=1 Tax=uncultured Corynebacterium sp. TaxID=159447 RepID=UPI0025D07FF6|nr:helix-turn-helix domain-containing protein [uncultured Corynebacterium sp.]